MQIPTAQLGRFAFGLDTGSVDSLSRNWSFRWASQERLGLNPAKQFTGLGDQTLSISGMIFPGEIGEAYFVEELAKEAGTGNPLLLVTNVKDVGQVLGYWCINSCQETSGNLDYQNKARTISFSLSLSFYGDRYGNSAISNARG
ncbi:phage tail protein [Endozoicomonas ascidiicola]|uniref:phage tail protein n=1 Tax=Endozoicomonas ascidiicola TaxID=1698521 RepID=UPI0008339B3B|nr:phage tail protein [Endozoicomonas ascidiicola]